MRDNDFLFPADIYSKHLATINNIKFTRREIDVIACLLSARGTSKIASLLSIALRTVVTHIRNIMLKLECNSREGIIDFIERSHKLHFLREYYASLITEIAFEKSLKEISKLKRDKSPKYLLIYWENQGLKDAFLHHLSHHLEKVELKIDVREYNSHQKLEITEDDDRILLLLAKKEDVKDVSQELEKEGFIDLSEYKNYYFVVFEIFKKLLPQANFPPIVNTFEEQHKGIQYDSKSFYKGAAQIKSEENKLYKIAYFLNKKRLTFLAVILFISFLSSILWPFRKNEISTFTPVQFSSQESSVRSDLIIPIETTFLNRPELIAQIETHFRKSQGIQTIALVGSGGAGKTTLARQYARQQNANVLWEVNAETPESLKSSFENLAQVLAKTQEDKTTLKGLQEIDDPIEKEEKIIQFVKNHLRSYKSWVLIFDNVEKFTNIQKYFPRDSSTWGEGKIILTTRDSTIQNNAHIDNLVFIGELSPVQKFDLFTKITNHGNTPSSESTHIEKTKIFLEHIPPFPLDVSVAAYYLMSTGIPYEAYIKDIEECNKDFEAVQKNLLKEAGSYTRTRYGIIISSLQHIISTHKDFQDILLLVSLLDSQNIPRDLLEKYKNKSVIDNFIYNLKKHSFITKEAVLSCIEGSTFSIHRSTQAIILAYLIKTLDLEKNKNLMHHIGFTFEQYVAETIDKGTIFKIRALINHIKFFLSHDSLLDESTKYAIGGALGDAYAYLYQFMNAKPLLEESLTKLNPYSSENYNRVSRILTSLGLVYRELGQYEKAKDSLEKALLLYKKHLPKNYAGIAQALLRLGHVYRGTGKFEEAKDLYEQSLNIYKHHLSDNKEGIAWALGSLGIIYKEFGQYEKGKEYLNQALAILSENDAGFGWALAHLGSIFTSLGHFETAKEYLSNSVVIYRKTHSEHDLGLGWALAHLGDVYLNLGDFEKAKSFLEQGLIIYKKNHLSEYSTGFPWVLSHLGSTYMSLGDYEKARSLLIQSLQVYEKIFGQNHIKTARVLRNLGQNYLLEGNFERAEHYFHKAFLIFEAHQHPDSYIILENLAEFYLKKSAVEKNKGNIHPSQHLKRQALSHLEQALNTVKAHFSKDSPHIMRIETKLRDLEKK